MQSGLRFLPIGANHEKDAKQAKICPHRQRLAELAEWLKNDGQAGYITLSGSGEPTLHSGFEKVLEFIRSKTTIAAVLLTNGTMLKSREVREAAACATW